MGPSKVFLLLSVAAAATLLLATVTAAASTAHRHGATARRGSCVDAGLCCQHKNNSCRAYPPSNDADNDLLDSAADEEVGDGKKAPKDGGCFCDVACSELGDCCDDYREACEPVDCVLAEDWEDWGECDVRCGAGVKQRRRRVVQQPLNGGRPCGPTVEKRPCEGQQCKVARGTHNGAEELHETAYIIPAVYGEYRKSNKLGYNPFIDIRRNIFEHYDGKTAITRPSYCMEFELTSVRAACNMTAESDVETAAVRPRLTKGATVCVECQTQAMRKKLGSRCRGQGVLNKVTRWNAVTTPGCRGRWVMKSRQEECQCSVDSATSFVLV